MPDPLSRFRYIWEMDVHFKCPVVGAVLSVERHKKILIKCGYDVSNLQPYEYHQVIMASLHSKNKISIKVDNYIRSKARRRMIQILDMDEKEIRALWREDLNTGKVGAILYAIASHKGSGGELLNDVHGEVHMQSHANMTQIFEVRQKFARVEAAFAQEKKRGARNDEKMAQMARDRKIEAGKVSRLEEEALQMRKRIRELEVRLEQQAYPMDTIQSLEHKIMELEKQLKKEEEAFRVMDRKKRRMQIKFFSLQSENEVLQGEMGSLVDSLNALSRVGCSGEGCPGEEVCREFLQCPKRVFMIGGMARIHAYYRKLVESAGGEFDYHDGHLKSGNSNLEARVMRSDVVLCPVNCNSHNACLKVKKLCNRHNKCLKILKNSSLSTVSKALFSEESPVVLN